MQKLETTAMVMKGFSGDDIVQPKYVVCGRNRSHKSYRSHKTYETSGRETRSAFSFRGNSKNPGIAIVSGHRTGRSFGSSNAGELCQIRTCENPIKLGTWSTLPTFFGHGQTADFK